MRYRRRNKIESNNFNWLAITGLVFIFAVALFAAEVYLCQKETVSTTTGPATTHPLPVTENFPVITTDFHKPVMGQLGSIITDTNSAAFGGEVALTVGTPDTQARRSLKIICTVAGNVAVTYGDGSTGVWAVTVGTQTLPIAITTVNSAGTTATATYFNLK